MSSSREACVAALVTALVLIPASPAFAHHREGHICGGSAGIRGGTGSASTSCGDQDSRPAAVSVGSCDPDSDVVVSFGSPLPNVEHLYRQVELETPPPDGYSYMAGFNCAGAYIDGPHLVADPTAGRLVSVRDEALARVTPAFPEPNVSPADAVVHTPTWLWLDGAGWGSSSATETDGAVTVTVTAEPVEVVWDLGEGTRRCHGPGRPWSPDAQVDYELATPGVRDAGDPACTFTFVHSSTVHPEGVHVASVTVTWEFSWTVNGVPRGVFGTVDRTTGFDVRVGEVQALVTGY